MGRWCRWRLGVGVGLGVWLLAGGLAVRGQVLATSTAPEAARGWLLAAAVCGGLAVLLLQRVAPLGCERQPEVGLRPWRSDVRRRVCGVGVLGLAAAAAGLATLLVAGNAPDGAATL